uniref:Uncharacterized protein n=1 Tax=Haemonchus contortus TaxID=6289 RepID=A0A7I4YBB8_HAECO
MGNGPVSVVGVMTLRHDYEEAHEHLHNQSIHPARLQSCGNFARSHTKVQNCGNSVRFPYQRTNAPPTGASI